ncbi:MAG: nuclear transport factor 2 family protein [Opitutaceae bacterium]
MSAPQDTIVESTKQISLLWRAAKWEDLGRCFSEEVVQVGPRLRELTRGREAAVESYKQFFENARLIDYDEGAFRAEVWPGFAICTYEFRMKYEAEGKRRFSSGTDQFLFRQEPEHRWVAVWRFLDFWEDREDE